MSTPRPLRRTPTYRRRVDQATMRRTNLSLVLRHLREVGPASRARIATGTGLNKATVSSLVAGLVRRGLVTDRAVERGAVGRPGRIVGLAGRGICAIGVEVNADYLCVVALDLRDGSPPPHAAVRMSCSSGCCTTRRSSPVRGPRR